MLTHVHFPGTLDPTFTQSNWPTVSPLKPLNFFFLQLYVLIVKKQTIMYWFWEQREAAELLVKKKDYELFIDNLFSITKKARDRIYHSQY